jgi:hypothetical protein
MSILSKIEDIFILALILFVVVGCFMAVIKLGPERKCRIYGEQTGAQTNYVFLGGCYAYDGQKTWRVK